MTESGRSTSCTIAFDTSTDRGSVALRTRSGDVWATELGGARTHASSLVPALDRLLESVGLGYRDVGRVVVGSGPGSFTGVRVAAAAAKALVHVLGVPLIAVSSLEAAAWGPGWEGRGGRLVLFDARADRLFWAHYQVDGSVSVTRPPAAGVLDEVLNHIRERGPPAIACGGDGAWKHRRALEAKGADVLPEAGMPTATALLELAQLDPGPSPVENPARWQPQYLKPWVGHTESS